MTRSWFHLTAELSEPPGSMRVMASDREIVDLESRWYRHAGAKLNAIRELGLSPTAYYQRLNRLLDDPTAASEWPGIINRLRRMRDQRLRQRSARRVA